jgi:hypothetical protein
VPRPSTWWITRAVLLCGATALLLALAQLFGWLSRVQINCLAN